MSCVVNSEKHPGNFPRVTEESKKMIPMYPRFFRGSPYLTNGLIVTDKEAEKFKKMAYMIKLK